MNQLINVSLLSQFADVFVWGGICVLFVVFVWFIWYQRRQGIELRYELEQLDQLKENKIESEFVLKAMKLSTWHLNPKTMSLAIDSDYRDKSGWVAQLDDGSQAEELVQKLHPQDADRVANALVALCQGLTEDYHVEYRVMMPGNYRYYWEESYATVVERDMEGKPTSIVGTTMRIDDRKTLEMELIEARNRAEESDRLKSAFIANMSHEIRTPLNAIIGFTSVLPDLPEGEERTQLLALIHENTQKLLRIIDDVVNISKIESGQEQATMTNFDINLVLSELVERYSPNLKEGVTMTTAYACEKLMVTTDLNRFTEIIKHLLSNATKFTAAGTISVGYELPQEGRMRLWVRDTGKGIAQENQEHVFERFFKVDEFIPGAGLGLSICRTMAYSIGGTVTVESELGKGATFWLEIPIK